MCLSISGSYVHKYLQAIKPYSFILFKQYVPYVKLKVSDKCNVLIMQRCLTISVTSRVYYDGVHISLFNAHGFEKRKSSPILNAENDEGNGILAVSE